MAMKTIRATLQFDDIREQDIIKGLEGLAEKRQLSNVLASLVRNSIDSNKATSINGVASMSDSRTAFFDEVSVKLAAQDSKIDAIYNMCSDMYALARFNKAMGLLEKTDNLMLGQFILQRQQDNLKEVLGESSGGHTYESNKLMNEQDKADKLMGYIAVTYEAMMTEMRTPLLMTSATPNRATTKENQVKQRQSLSNIKLDDDEVIVLTSKPPVEKDIKENDSKAFNTKKAANILAFMGSQGSDDE